MYINRQLRTTIILKPSCLAHLVDESEERTDFLQRTLFYNFSITEADGFATGFLIPFPHWPCFSHKFVHSPLICNLIKAKKVVSLVSLPLTILSPEQTLALTQ